MGQSCVSFLGCCFVKSIFVGLPHLYCCIVFRCYFIVSVVSMAGSQNDPNGKWMENCNTCKKITMGSKWQDLHCNALSTILPMLTPTKYYHTVHCNDYGCKNPTWQVNLGSPSTLVYSETNIVIKLSYCSSFPKQK